MLCLEYKVVTVEYFLDRMQYYELQLLLENANVSVKNSWETTRNMMWSFVQPYSKKKLKPTDIMSLPWDENAQHVDTHREVTQKDIEHMKSIMESRKKAMIEMGTL